MILAVIAFLVLGVRLSRGRTSPTGPDAGAFAWCRQEIRTALRDPASAMFADETADPQTDGAYLITGVVSAAAPDGQRSEHRYLCEVQERGGRWGLIGWRWDD